MDWSATMLAAAGAPTDPAYPLDGVSLLPVLQGAGREFARPLHWRMNHRGPRQPERLAAMRQAWEDWNASMPPIPADATVSLGYSTKDMPQR